VIIVVVFGLLPSILFTILSLKFFVAVVGWCFAVSAAHLTRIIIRIAVVLRWLVGDHYYLWWCCLCGREWRESRVLPRVNYLLTQILKGTSMMLCAENREWRDRRIEENRLGPYRFFLA
jgi:hypothetical protein